MRLQLWFEYCWISASSSCFQSNSCTDSITASGRVIPELEEDVVCPETARVLTTVPGPNPDAVAVPPSGARDPVATGLPSAENDWRTPSVASVIRVACPLLFKLPTLVAATWSPLFWSALIAFASVTLKAGLPPRVSPSHTTIFCEFWRYPIPPSLATLLRA